MILISDVDNTIWLRENGKPNSRLLEAYKLVADNGVKIHLCTSGGWANYSGEHNASLRSAFRETMAKAFAEDVAFFSNDGAGIITDTDARPEVRAGIPDGFPKIIVETYEAIKDYFPEEKDFIFVDDNAKFRPLAEKAGFKTFDSLSQETPEELLTYVGEKLGVELVMPSFQDNTPSITEHPKTENKKPGFWNKVFSLKNS